LDDERERTVTVKVPAERRAWRIAGPSLPFAPTRVTFRIAMFVIVRVVVQEVVDQVDKSLSSINLRLHEVAIMLIKRRAARMRAHCHLELIEFAAHKPALAIVSWRGKEGLPDYYHRH
jgi:hypothetical protein